MLLVILVIIIGFGAGCADYGTDGQDLVPTQDPPGDPNGEVRASTTIPRQAPVVYLPDDDPCVRPSPKYATSGQGQALLERVSAAEAVLLRLQGHSKPLRFAAFSPGGQTVVTASREEVRIWQAASGRLLHDLELPSDAVAPTLSPDGALLALGSEGPAVQLWDVATGTMVRELPVTVEAERAQRDLSGNPLLFDPDGR